MTVAVVAALGPDDARTIDVFPSCRAALAHAGTRQQERKGGLRVGVAVGDATESAAGWVGPPVDHAGELASAAQPGEILVSEIAVQIAGTLAGPFGPPHDTLSARPLAWEPRPRPSPLPFPSLLATHGFPFVGRVGERHQVQAAASGPLDRTRIVLLSGEPGIGKTRTAAEVAAHLHQAGHLVLAGRCDEGLRVPYQPFLGALRQVVRTLPAHDLAPSLGRYPSELSRLAPELTDLVPDLPPPLRSDPETEQYRLFEAVASWLDALGGLAPVVFVVDDLHWAAQPTLLLLRHIATSQRAPRLCVIATYRDSDVGPEHPLTAVLADLRSLPEVTRIALRGFGDLDAETFVAAAAGTGQTGDDAARTLARELGARTAGNPFFLGEVVRDLSEAGAFAGKPDGVEHLVPASVHDVVVSRLARLPDDTRDALVVAAVTGHEVDAETVATVLGNGFDTESTAGALDAAVAAGLLNDVPGRLPRYRFAHAIVQATIYEQLGAARRARLHRSIADAIEAGPTTREREAELAHHWGHASGPDAPEQALAWTVRAGQRALDQLAHAEAADWFAAGLLRLDVMHRPDPARRIDLLTALG
ncbi:MAG: ATP-binding protein, partial [Acidimicrobiales bacterium]